MFNNILQNFNLNADDCTIQPFGSGLINSTWKVSSATDAYILQRINTNIFKSPQDIAHNLLFLQQYLQETAPGYLFPTPLPTINNQYLVMHGDEYYRLQPFIKNSHTVDVVASAEQAYEAAKQFGKFTKLLNGFDAPRLRYTLPNFHNLSLRVDQFKAALQSAGAERLTTASAEIKKIARHESIVDTYSKLVNDPAIPLRVIHHDTKISNVLFNADDKGLCVIDLDTVMPGYFISDVGDMMRTYLSPVNEEERDLSQISIREDHLKAIHQGYLEEMGDVLTPAEKELFFYSGKFMIYMQALRFLTDYLNGDVYYHTTYPGQNLVRAKNQLMLLSRLVEVQK